MALCVPETDWSCADPAWLDQLEPPVKLRAEQLAWSTLQALTGYRLAVCPIEVRPCSQGCIDAARTYYEAPVTASGYSAGGTFSPGINTSGAWVNSCGCRPNDCSCSSLSIARLEGPVGGIVSVVLNGATLDPSAYRVDNNNELVRLDGESWPACQDMAAPLTEEGTFGVTYYRGLAPDNLAAWSAGQLAVEYAKACGGKKCALPSNVQTITRQGVSIDVSAGLFPGGATGIATVDAYIYTLNPYGLRTPSRVSSPDVRRPRMTTAR